jgi:hypothetical protein
MSEVSKSSVLLNPENFDRGLLVDDEWMAGISKENDEFLAYVVNHTEGSLVARESFKELPDALAALNRIPRTWHFEATGGCAGDRCGEGKCKGEACRVYSGPKKTASRSCS